MKNILLYLLVIVGLMSCQKEDFTITGMAEDHFFLRSEGQTLPITVAGNLDSKKMLLVIHGGPGGSGISYRDRYVKDFVEKDVALVYWDQRFAGGSQGNKGSSSLASFNRDIKSIIRLLKEKYGTDNQIYLFGHSWGGFLAPFYLLEGQNQVEIDGWIQIGGAHNYRMNDSLTREMLLHYGDIELKASRNTTDWTEIVDWCRQNGFEGKDNSTQLNQFAHRAEGLFDNINTIDPEFEEIIATPLGSAFTNLIVSGIIREIDQQTFDYPNSDRLNQINIPTLLLWGKYDFVCPPELAIDIEENIGSSDVQKVIFQNSGHSPMANEPERFWNSVLDWIETR